MATLQKTDYIKAILDKTLTDYRPGAKGRVSIAKDLEQLHEHTLAALAYRINPDGLRSMPRLSRSDLRTLL